MSELTDIIRTLPNFDPYKNCGDCVFNEELAQRAVDFFPKFLTLSKDCAKASMGTPFILQKFQIAIVANIFGWLRTDGTRRFREVFLLLPRKSGKSELISGLACYLGLCDGEKGGEIVSAASDRNQASLVFNSAKTMLKANAKLSKRVKIFQHSIVFPNNTTYKSISAESYSKHGMNLSGCFIDELHSIQDRDLIDVLTTSIGARKQPLVCYITTADFNRPSIYAEIYKRAVKCRDAESKLDPGFDPYFLPVIYQALPDEDWKGPEVWARVNPNLGVSIQLDYLEQECKKAISTPSYENTFKRLFLNLSTESDKRWLSSTDWDKCSGQPFDISTLDGQGCIGALDLASTKDIACFLLYFPDSKVVLPHFFSPADTAEIRERLDKVPYTTWQRSGHMNLTSGNCIDYSFIKALILQLAKQYSISEIAYDPWNATQIALQLQDAGLTMIEFRQGFMSLNEPSKAFESLVMKHELKHLDNPVLKWMAGNVTIETNPEGSIKPSKAKSIEKIDGIVCCCMAVGRSLLRQEFKSVYSEREVLFVDCD